ARTDSRWRTACSSADRVRRPFCRVCRRGCCPAPTADLAFSTPTPLSFLNTLCWPHATFCDWGRSPLPAAISHKRGDITMYSRQRSYSSHQAVAGGRHRSVLRPWMAGLVLPMGLVMSACGDGEVDTTGDAEQLHEAQPPHYRDATQVPEGSENGVYSEL